MRKVVLTGGPGAGKSVITSALAAREPRRFVRVPEAATAVYERLQTRWDRLDLAGREDVQRQIYQQQIRFEDEIAKEQGDRILLLDRGTLDGAAYWPAGHNAYWAAIGTTRQRELQRYDAVIWLETCAALGFYDGHESNPCRFEDASAAIASGKLLLTLWGDHPHLHHVGAFENLEDKISAVRETIAEMIDGG